MIFRLLKICTLCAMLSIFSIDDAYAMNPYIPALEAGYDSESCVYSESTYILTVDWITLMYDDSLIKEVTPDTSVHYGWIQPTLSYDALTKLRKNIVYHEDYVVMPENSNRHSKHEFSPVCNSYSFDSAKISGKITIPGNQRDTAFLEINAIGPKFKKIVSSMFANGIMTLRINRPVLLRGYCAEKDKCSFLLIELKDGGYSCG